MPVFGLNVADSEGKKIKQAELARHWRCSEANVSKLVKEKAMPAFTSLEAADAWRAEHAPPRKRASASEKKGLEGGEKNARSFDTQPGEGKTNGERGAERDEDDDGDGEFRLSTDESRDPTAAESRAKAAAALGGRGVLPFIDVETFVDRTRDFDAIMIDQAERVPQIAFGLLTLKQKTGLAGPIAAATTNWHQAAKAAASVRNEFLDIQERTRALIQLDQVMDILGTELQAWRSFADKLGERAGPEANPADPAVATAAINRHLDLVYARLATVLERARNELGAGSAPAAS